MSKAHDLIEAETESESTNAWKCKTCDRPRQDEQGEYCLHCKFYWEDVSAGCFDDDETLICPRSKEPCVRAFCDDYGCADKLDVSLDEYDYAQGSTNFDELIPRLPAVGRKR